MARENIEVVREVIDAWNRRDLAAAQALHDPQCELRPTQATETLHGHEGHAATFRDWFESFEEYRMEPEDFIVHGDRVLVPMRQHARGARSGLALEQRFYQLYTLRERKIVRFEEYSEEPEALEALRRRED
jgi:ketosteroid isomerase-like protein